MSSPNNNYPWGRIEVFRRKDRKWQWRVKSRNHRIIMLGTDRYDGPDELIKQVRYVVRMRHHVTYKVYQDKAKYWRWTAWVHKDKVFAPYEPFSSKRHAWGSANLCANTLNSIHRTDTEKRSTGLFNVV